MVKIMLSIVISKVFKYKALILGVILVSTLAFFQSNQALDETGSQEKEESEINIESKNQQPGSTSKNADKVLAEDKENASVTTGTSRVSISIKANTSTNSENIEQDEETTISEVRREFKNGSVKLSFKTNGESQKIEEEIEEKNGQISIDFDSEYDEDSDKDIKIETEINQENNTKD